MELGFLLAQVDWQAHKHKPVLYVILNNREEYKQLKCNVVLSKGGEKLFVIKSNLLQVSIVRSKFIPYKIYTYTVSPVSYTHLTLPTKRIV